MKTILVCTLIMASSPVLAVNKCVIDGKTVYQQSPCVGESKAIEGNVSSVGSQYLRDKITEKQAIEDAEKQQQAIEALQRQQSAKDEKIDRISRKLDTMQRDAIIERDQNNLRRRFGAKY